MQTKRKTSSDKGMISNTKKKPCDKGLICKKERKTSGDKGLIIKQ